MATKKVPHAVASKSPLTSRPPVVDAEAFAYDPSDSADSVLADVIKGTLAVAYLMTSLVDGGRENKLDGATAQAFADTLREYAARADHFLIHDRPIEDRMAKALRQM